MNIYKILMPIHEAHEWAFLSETKKKGRWADGQIEAKWSKKKVYNQ